MRGKIAQGLLGHSLSKIRIPKDEEARESYQTGFAAGYLIAKSKYGVDQ